MDDLDDLDDLAQAFVEDAPQEEVQGEPEEQPQQESALGAEGEPETEPSEIDEVEEEGDSPDEAESEVATVEEQVLTMTDGSQVSRQELIEGYMRQQDYSRKTAELSTQREAGDKEAQQIKQRQLDVLTALEQQLQSYNPLVGMQQQLNEALELGDSEAANEIRWQMMNEQGRQQHMRQKLGHERQKREQEESANSQKEKEMFLTEQQAALREKMPELKTLEAQQSFIDKANAALFKVGFTKDELKSIEKPDHRHVLLAHKAALYDEMVSKKPQVAETLKGKNVSPKTTARPKAQSKLSNAYRQLEENPNSMEGFVGLFA